MRAVKFHTAQQENARSQHGRNPERVSGGAFHLPDYARGSTKLAS
jgi:hypothetical protein